ncbi:glyoxalase [Microbacterium faecale]|uniref:Glyoxalase n=1 Tax=Microbacterium faecale TaxID=1804630 RepID=A0A917DJW1_9MICO|nr:VOC family protein [Microbacterium faecale]GGD42833.1 glyoxalase [Microbacterium faecale]
MTSSTATITLSLPITDRARAMAFYRDAFAFHLVGTLEEDGIPEPLQFRLDSQTLLALIPADGLGWVLGDRPLAPPGVSECLLGMTLATEAEVNNLVERVRHAGSDVITAPRTEFWGYTALCLDPDGHAWQLTASPTT